MAKNTKRNKKSSKSSSKKDNKANKKSGKSAKDSKKSKKKQKEKKPIKAVNVLKEKNKLEKTFTLTVPGVPVLRAGDLVKIPKNSIMEIILTHILFVFESWISCTLFLGNKKAKKHPIKKLKALVSIP